MTEVNDMLAKMVEDMEAKAEKLDDSGHQRLMTDMKKLFTDAGTGLFHDFHKNGDMMPKMALIQRLDMLAQNAKNGDYDN